MVLENAPALTDLARVAVPEPSSQLIELASRMERSYNDALQLARSVPALHQRNAAVLLANEEELPDDEDLRSEPSCPDGRTI